MFTFTIVKGKVVPTDGVPDYVFAHKDYKRFLDNLSIFEEQFPDCVFGCVDELDSTYDLVDEKRIPLDKAENEKEGVYFGLYKR